MTTEIEIKKHVLDYMDHSIKHHHKMMYSNLKDMDYYYADRHKQIAKLYVNMRFWLMEKFEAVQIETTDQLKKLILNFIHQEINRHKQLLNKAITAKDYHYADQMEMIVQNCQGLLCQLRANFNSSLC